MATNVTTVNNLSNLPNLLAIDFTANQITTLEIADCTNLQEVRLGNNSLVTLNVSNTPLINVINLNSNPNFNIINLPILTICGYFNANGCSLPTSTVNAILVALANQSNTGGVVFLDGGSNGVATSPGITAADTLTSRSWTVTYNT